MNEREAGKAAEIAQAANAIRAAATRGRNSNKNSNMNDNKGVAPAAPSSSSSLNSTFSFSRINPQTGQKYPMGVYVKLRAQALKMFEEENNKKITPTAK